MTEKEIEQYGELAKKLEKQANLILSIFSPLTSWEHFTRVEFYKYSGIPFVRIYYYGHDLDGAYEEYYFYPQSYFHMSEKELIEERDTRKEQERINRVQMEKERSRGKRVKSKTKSKKNDKEDGKLGNGVCVR